MAADHDAQPVLRGAVSPTETADAFAIQQIAWHFLGALTPQSVGADLITRGLSLNFNRAAQFRVPGSGLPEADFVAEAATIPVVQLAPNPSIL